jgi:hypothetical protein
MGPVMVTHARATYNGRSLTLGQAQGLTDPEYLQDIDAIANHIEGCKRAKIPRIAGELFWLVGSANDIYRSRESQFRDRDDTDVTGRNAAILEEAAKRFNAKH